MVRKGEGGGWGERRDPRLLIGGGVHRQENGYLEGGWGCREKYMKFKGIIKRAGERGNRERGRENDKKDTIVSELVFISLPSIFSVATRNFLRSICCFISSKVKEKETPK